MEPAAHVLPYYRGPATADDHQRLVERSERRVSRVVAEAVTARREHGLERAGMVAQVLARQLTIDMGCKHATDAATHLLGLATRHVTDVTDAWPIIGRLHALMLLSQHHLPETAADSLDRVSDLLVDHADHDNVDAIVSLRCALLDLAGRHDEADAIHIST